MLGDDSTLTSVMSDSASMMNWVWDDPSTVKLNPGRSAEMIGVMMVPLVAVVLPRVSPTGRSCPVSPPP